MSAVTLHEPPGALRPSIDSSGSDISDDDALARESARESRRLNAPLTEAGFELFAGLLQALVDKDEDALKSLLESAFPDSEDTDDDVDNDKESDRGCNVDSDFASRSNVVSNNPIQRNTSSAILSRTAETAAVLSASTKPLGRCATRVLTACLVVAARLRLTGAASQLVKYGASLSASVTGLFTHVHRCASQRCASHRCASAVCCRERSQPHQHQPSTGPGDCRPLWRCGRRGPGLTALHAALLAHDVALATMLVQHGSDARTPIVHNAAVKRDAEHTDNDTCGGERCCGDCMGACERQCQCECGCELCAVLNWNDSFNNNHIITNNDDDVSSSISFSDKTRMLTASTYCSTITGSTVPTLVLAALVRARVEYSWDCEHTSGLNQGAGGLSLDSESDVLFPFYAPLSGTSTIAHRYGENPFSTYSYTSKATIISPATIISNNNKNIKTNETATCDEDGSGDDHNGSNQVDEDGSDDEDYYLDEGSNAGSNGGHSDDSESSDADADTESDPVSPPLLSPLLLAIAHRA